MNPLPQPALRHTPSAHQIGSQIRAHRILRHVSQAALAQQAGTTQATIARIEAGTSNPSLSTLDGIARALSSYIQIRLRR